MATLYIRNKSCSYITFLRTREDFVQFVDYYIPGRPLTIGDLATFNKPMRNLLLKFIEENPEVDCYSSEDIVDTVIQSRFIRIIKDPLEFVPDHSLDAFKESDKSHLSALLHLSGASNQVKLRVPLLSNQLLKLVL